MKQNSKEQAVDKFNSLPLELLRERLSYDKDTGIFRWLKTLSNNTKPGGIVNNINTEGYAFLIIGGHYLMAHRAAWAMHYGEWPSHHVDHINRDKLDNRIANLRTVTNSENEQNKGLQKNNTSGYRGVAWNKRRNKWVAAIKNNGKHLHLGYFEKKEDAVFAYSKAASYIHKYNPAAKAAPEPYRPQQPERTTVI